MNGNVLSSIVCTPWVRISTSHVYPSCRLKKASNRPSPSSIIRIHLKIVIGLPVGSQVFSPSNSNKPNPRSHDPAVLAAQPVAVSQNASAGVPEFHKCLDTRVKVAALLSSGLVMVAEWSLLCQGVSSTTNQS